MSPCPRRFAAPYGAAIRPGQLVLLSARPRDSVKAYMRGVDLGCDPASWFSVADASMGKDGRPDLHSVPTHARRRGLPPGVLVPGRAEGPPALEGRRDVGGTAEGRRRDGGGTPEGRRRDADVGGTSEGRAQSPPLFRHPRPRVPRVHVLGNNI